MFSVVGRAEDLLADSFGCLVVSRTGLTHIEVWICHSTVLGLLHEGRAGLVSLAHLLFCIFKGILVAVVYPLFDILRLD